MITFAKGTTPERGIAIFNVTKGSVVAVGVVPHPSQAPSELVSNLLSVVISPVQPVHPISSQRASLAAIKNSPASSWVPLSRPFLPDFRATSVLIALLDCSPRLLNKSLIRFPTVISLFGIKFARSSSVSLRYDARFVARINFKVEFTKQSFLVFDNSNSFVCRPLVSFEVLLSPTPPDKPNFPCSLFSVFISLKRKL